MMVAWVVKVVAVKGGVWGRIEPPPRSGRRSLRSTGPAAAEATAPNRTKALISSISKSVLVPELRKASGAQRWRRFGSVRRASNGGAARRL